MSRHYSNAPIVEAVINLHVEGTTALDPLAFEQVARNLPNYPKQTQIRGIQMGFSGGDTSNPQFHSKYEDVGIRLETSDGSRVLQLQKQMFVFSHMPPYTNWERFSQEAQTLWPMFVQASGTQVVTRLAVRVINKLKVPVLFADLKQYSNLLPHMPEGIPVPADTFFMQFQLSLEHIAEGCRAVVNVASGIQNDRSISELLLDFDLFVEHRFDAADKTMWSTLDKLSEGKNQLFEACITDATRKLIS